MPWRATVRDAIDSTSARGRRCKPASLFDVRALRLLLPTRPNNFPLSPAPTPSVTSCHSFPALPGASPSVLE